MPVTAASLGPLNQESYLAIQKEFFEAYQEIEDCTSKLDHDEYQLPEKEIPIERIGEDYFRNEINDFSINLINLLNQACGGVNRIAGWGTVYYNEDRPLPDRLYILGTLLYPLLMAWVSAPYMFKQRIAYCTLSSLNSWAAITDRNRREINEEGFNFRWLHNNSWERIAENAGLDIILLREKYAELSKTETGEFRRKLVHRYPPNFEYGSSSLNFHTRHSDNARGRRGKLLVMAVCLP